jgi:PAS domain S-box-containing protein
VSSGSALGLSLLFQPLLQRTSLIIPYTAIFVTAWLGRRGPGLLSVLLMAISTKALLLPPGSIWLDAMTLTLFTTIGLTTVAALSQLRERTAVLREKDRQLTDFMENAAMGMHWLAEDGTIIWANNAQGSLLGYSLAEYVGKKFQDFHVEARDAREILQRLAGNEQLKNFETRLRAKDGSIKTVLLDADVQWREQTFVHARCFLRDLTARQHMEEALRQSELRFRQLAENINVVFWLWSPRERQFLYISQVYEKVWGRSCESLIADPASFIETVHTEDRAAVLEKIKSQEAGEHTMLEYRILRPDGAVRWVRDRAFPLQNDSGEVQRIAGLTEDVTEQKQAKDALSQERNVLRTLIDNLPDYIYAKDRESRFLICNQANVRLLGARSEAELQNKTIADLCPPEIARRFLEDDRIVMEKGSPLFDREEPFIQPDGQARTFLTTKLPLRDASGAVIGLVGISKDITDRQRAEEALRRSEANLRLAQRIGRIGSWEADLEKNILQWSEETYRIFGCRPEMFTPTEEGFLALVHPDDRANYRKSADHALKHGKYYSVDYRVVCPNGVERYLVQQARIVRDAEGKPIQMIGTVQDLTERRLAEEALRESEERFRILFERSPEAIFILDPHDRERLLPILDCNDVACRQHGYDRTEIVRQPLSALDPQMNTRERVNEFIAQVRRQQPLVVETCHRRKDATWLDVESQVSLIALGNRELLLVMDRDVSGRKKAEEAVQKVNEALEARVQERTRQLEEANRELEAFSYSISHDLRAPVRAINGFSRIIQEEHASGLDDETLRLFRIITANAQRMGELIDDLLAFSKLSAHALHPGPVDMKALARSVARELAEETADRKVTVQIGELPAAGGDPSLLRQVFANLIGNALKFSRHSDGPVVEIGGWHDGSQCIYCVKDNGVGFDMKYVGKLFRVFQRLHKPEQFEGTGVGLAIVHRVVQRHGGRVWAEGEPGRGASFFFSLPLAETKRRANATI